MDHTPDAQAVLNSHRPASRSQSLRARLDGLSEDISLYLAMALMFPFMVSTMYFADMWARGVTLAESRWLMLLLLAEVRSPAAGFSPMEQQPGATP